MRRVIGILWVNLVHFLEEDVANSDARDFSKQQRSEWLLLSPQLFPSIESSSV